MQDFDVVLGFLPVVILGLAGVAAISAFCGALIFRRILRDEARADESADLTRATEDYMKWLGRAVAALGVFALVLVSVYVVLPLEDEGLKLALLIAAVGGAVGFGVLGIRVGALSGERAIRAARSAARRAKPVVEN